LWPLTPALTEQRVNFWVEAVAPARVWQLPWPAWQAACANWSVWQALERDTLALSLDDKMQRTATQCYAYLCSQRPAWLARIPLRHLASYLASPMWRCCASAAC
jgi:hypothetical protein